MRLFKPFIAVALLSISGASKGQDIVETDSLTLSEYVVNNPNCLTKEIIYDGCTLMMNSDGEYLFGQFTILHPELQMRILMQGLHMYVDPTGKKKEKYAINFPAASSVQDVMQQVAPPQISEGQESNQIPDIVPLVDALNSYGVSYDINNREQAYSSDWASISVNPELHALTYSFIVPVEDFLKEKKVSDTWKIGLLSEGDNTMKDGQGNGPSMGAPTMMAPPRAPGARGERHGMQKPIESKDAEALRKIMIRDIESWSSFSFNELCSAND